MNLTAFGSLAMAFVVLFLSKPHCLCKRYFLYFFWPFNIGLRHHLHGLCFFLIPFTCRFKLLFVSFGCLRSFSSCPWDAFCFFLFCHSS